MEADEDAHEEDGGHMASEPASYLPVDPFGLALYDFALIAAIVAVSLFFPSILTPKIKKAFFILIAVPVVLITLYIGGSTVYLNLISYSGGPAHWHADFEIWACGEKITNLPTSKLPANFVGTPTFHYHDDFRIHVEGIVVERKDVTLGGFFKVIGGSLGGESMSVPLENGSHLAYRNGDLCPNGKPGKLRLYLRDWALPDKFVESAEMDNYVLKPYFNVPPVGSVCISNCGDFMKIAFETG
ncbi:MAG: hypothetical protein AABX01_07110 [Candidatus Micrarchaeota archaeon]